MDIEEMLARESIRKTAALYTRAVDNRRYYELESVFAKEAVISVHGRGELRGLDQIIAAFEEGARTRHASATGNFQRHNLSTAMIDVEGGARATAVHYVTVVTELGFDHAGLYRDIFRRQSGGDWLIERREARMEWVRPDSRFAAWLGRATPLASF